MSWITAGACLFWGCFRNVWNNKSWTEYEKYYWDGVSRSKLINKPRTASHSEGFFET